MRTQRNCGQLRRRRARHASQLPGWPAAVILAAILTIPVLSHETPAVPDRAASVDGLGAASVAAAATPGASRRSLVPEVWPSPRATRDPEPVRQAVPERSPQPTSHRTGRSVTGTATWFCGGGSACTRGYGPDCLCAAAGPQLRVSAWRGRLVRVASGGRVVVVRLIDWCACPGRVIDLYRGAFSQLADPSVGVLKVTVTW